MKHTKGTKEFIIGFDTWLRATTNYDDESIFYIEKDIHTNEYSYYFVKDNTSSYYVLYAYMFVQAFLNFVDEEEEYIPAETLDVNILSNIKVFNTANTLMGISIRLGMLAHIKCDDNSIDKFCDDMFAHALDTLWELFKPKEYFN